nr:FKBP-type peptidyl-prolyl cis-trans isomerase [uncultured Tolumonas sp.]
MQKMIKMSLLAVAVAVSMTACQKDEPKAPVADKVELKTFEQQSAYAIGLSMGRYINSTLSRQQDLGVKLDNDMIMNGVKDGLAKKAQMSDADIEKALKAYDQKVNEAATKKAETDAKSSLEKGKKYLEDNAKKAGVTVTQSGLQYEVLKMGTGEKPKASDVVRVHYLGTLPDGTKFDSSYDRKEPAEFPLDHVIPGWTEGVQLMPVGSKFKFTLPAALAYGEQGAGTIPPNSVLVFEVELLEIVKDQVKAADAPAKTEAKK